MRPQTQSQPNEGFKSLPRIEAPIMDHQGFMKEVRNYLHNQKTKYPCKKVTFTGCIVELIAPGKGKVIGKTIDCRSIFKIGYESTEWNENNMKDYDQN